MNIDLNAARRARSETYGEPNTLTFGEPEETVELPHELPYEFAEKLMAQDFRAAVTVVLNGRSEAFFDWAPSVQDLEEFANQISEAYTGREPGESSASRSTSKATSGSSRRPSSKRTRTSPG